MYCCNVSNVFNFSDQELRNIIDKLAQFVARNGPEFEQMTKNKQKDNPKFSFLFGDLNQAVVSMPALLSSESQVLTGMEGPKTFTTTKVCPPVCPADDFSCNALTTVDNRQSLLCASPLSPKSHETHDVIAIDDECDEMKKARPGGFEPPTDGLEIRCSIRLSYERG